MTRHRRRYNPDGVFWGGILFFALWASVMTVILWAVTQT